MRRPSLYQIWKVDGNSQGKPTPIMIQELDSSGTAFKSESSAEEILRDSEPWESVGLSGLVEGPWLLHRGDYYYLFYSGSGYAGSSYAVGVARSSALKVRGGVGVGGERKTKRMRDRVREKAKDRERERERERDRRLHAPSAS